MRAYQLKNEIKAKKLRHLLLLNAECIRLKWSRDFKDIPDTVSDSLDSIISYISTTVPKECEPVVVSLSDDEEEAVINVIKVNPIIRESLGSGVVLQGEEAVTVLKIIKNEVLLSKLVFILESGKNLILL